MWGLSFIRGVKHGKFTGKPAIAVGVYAHLNPCTFSSVLVCFTLNEWMLLQTVDVCLTKQFKNIHI